MPRGQYCPVVSGGGGGGARRDGCDRRRRDGSDGLQHVFGPLLHNKGCPSLKVGAGNRTAVLVPITAAAFDTGPRVAICCMVLKGHLCGGGGGSRLNQQNEYYATGLAEAQSSDSGVGPRTSPGPRAAAGESIRRRIVCMQSSWRWLVGSCSAVCSRSPEASEADGIQHIDWCSR